MTTQPRAPAQTSIFSHLEKMVAMGEYPPLHTLLSMLPNDPLEVLAPCQEPIPADSANILKTRLGKFVAIPHTWSASQLALARQFRGIQLNYWAREVRRFNSAYDEPLSGWIREFLVTLQMIHSRAVIAHTAGWRGDCSDCTNMPFEEWLPEYLEETNWYERFGGLGERWVDAAAVVRLSCGLPQLAQPKPGGVR